MPQYHYRAFTKQGTFVEGVAEANSKDVAEDLLWAQGLTVFAARETNNTGAQAWWRREFFARVHLKPAELAVFTRDLAVLHEAEIPLDDALRLQADQGSNQRLRWLARAMLDEVLDGSHLSDAMARRPRSFGADYVGIVRAGEIGARTAQVLAELADLLEQRLEMRAKMVSALVYPCILILMALASVALILSVLVPTFAPIFAESGRPLPSGIAALVALRDHWLEAAAGIALLLLAVTAIAGLVSRSPAGRRAFDSAMLRMPIVGPLLAQREIARLSRTLATLLRAGVPLLNGLETAKTLVGNVALAEAMAGAADGLRGGENLSTALRNVTLLPPIAVRMIAVGERAGRLDEVLLRVAVMFETETRRRVDRLMSVLSPVLTIAISGVVGGLIFTVMNAIISINDLAAQ